MNALNSSDVTVPGLASCDPVRVVSVPSQFALSVALAVEAGWLAYGPHYDRGLRERLWSAARHGDMERWRLFQVRFDYLTLRGSHESVTVRTTNARFRVSWYSLPGSVTPHLVEVLRAASCVHVGAFFASNDTVQALGIELPEWVADV